MALRLLKEEDSMKLLVSLNSKKVNDYLDYTNSFIIGLKDYSINYLEFTYEEIEDLIKENNNLEIFVSINKNIFNNEIKNLENILLKLNKLNIKGILFYDLAVLSIVKRLNLDIPLCFHQTHMVTNYNTCNYYFHKGCKYAYLSSEITGLEMKEISDKSDISLMALFMGHPIVSHSKRKLLSNYFANYQYEKKEDSYIIKSGNSANYFIRENNNGTSILYGNIINGSHYIIDLKEKIDYAILDENFIEHQLFLQILSLYKKIIEDSENQEEYLVEIEKLIGNDTGFFNKKTIYKVKKNEKN